VEKVFALYREKYFDLNVQHFHEKFKQDHGIELSYTWVKQALQGAGLVARGRKRGVHRKRRERLPGMLLHVDGSRHQWLQDKRWYDLIVTLDDATSEIYYAQLVEEESTVTVMAGLREVIQPAMALFASPVYIVPRKNNNAHTKMPNSMKTAKIAIMARRSHHRAITCTSGCPALPLCKWRAVPHPVHAATERQNPYPL